MNSKLEMRIFKVYFKDRGCTKRIEAIKYRIVGGDLCFYDETHRKIASFKFWDHVLADGAEIE